MKTIRAVSVGQVASAVIAQYSAGSIRGFTSRGIFINLDDAFILFLSRERFAGPLIINIPDSELFESLSINSQIQTEGERFLFPANQVTVDWSQANKWSASGLWPPVPLSPSTPLPNAAQILRFLSSLKNQARNPNELLEAVGNILRDGPPPTLEGQVGFFSLIDAITDGIRQRDHSAILAAASRLAGLGRGLTPSGDDFILGIVYGLYRLKHFYPDLNSTTAPELSTLVRRRSTLISANLVACALNGEVDQRIGAIFDALLHPEVPSREAIHEILSWGSSSGLDATAGMALIVALAE